MSNNLINSWKEGAERNKSPRLNYSMFLENNLDNAKFVRKYQNQGIDCDQLIETINLAWNIFYEEAKKEEREQDIITALNGVKLEEVEENIKNTTSSSFSQNKAYADLIKENSVLREEIKKINECEIVLGDDEAYHVWHKTHRKFIGKIDMVERKVYISSTEFFDREKGLWGVGIDNSVLECISELGENFSLILNVKGYGMKVGLSAWFSSSIEDYNKLGYQINANLYKNPRMISSQKFLSYNNLKKINDWSFEQ